MAQVLWTSGRLCTSALPQPPTTSLHIHTSPCAAAPARTATPSARGPAPCSTVPDGAAASTASPPGAAHGQAIRPDPGATRPPAQPRAAAPPEAPAPSRAAAGRRAIPAAPRLTFERTRPPGTPSAGTWPALPTLPTRPPSPTPPSPPPADQQQQQQQQQQRPSSSPSTAPGSPGRSAGSSSIGSSSKGASGSSSKAAAGKGKEDTLPLAMSFAAVFGRSLADPAHDPSPKGVVDSDGAIVFDYTWQPDPDLDRIEGEPPPGSDEHTPLDLQADADAAVRKAYHPLGPLPPPYTGALQPTLLKGKGWGLVSEVAVEKGELLLVSLPLLMAQVLADATQRPQARQLVAAALDLLHHVGVGPACARGVNATVPQQRRASSGKTASPSAAAASVEPPASWGGLAVGPSLESAPVDAAVLASLYCGDPRVTQAPPQEIAGWRSGKLPLGPPVWQARPALPKSPALRAAAAAVAAVRARQAAAAAAAAKPAAPPAVAWTEEQLEALFKCNVMEFAPAEASLATVRKDPVTALVGIWPEAALINHSCSPNTSLTLVGDRLVVRASRVIQAGEEVCIDWLGEQGLMQPLAARRAALAARYGFHCRCRRCWLEERQQGALTYLERDLTRAVQQPAEQLSQALRDGDLAGLEAALPPLEAALGDYMSSLDELHLEADLTSPPSRLALVSELEEDAAGSFRAGAGFAATAGSLARQARLEAGLAERWFTGNAMQLLLAVAAAHAARAQLLLEVLDLGPGWEDGVKAAERAAAEAAAVAEAAAAAAGFPQRLQAALLARRSAAGSAAAAAAAEQAAALLSAASGDEEGGLDLDRRQDPGIRGGSDDEDAAEEEEGEWDEAELARIEKGLDALQDAMRAQAICADVAEALAPGSELHVLQCAKLAVLAGCARELDAAAPPQLGAGAAGEAAFAAQLARYGPLDLDVREQLLRAALDTAGLRVAYAQQQHQQRTSAALGAAVSSDGSAAAADAATAGDGSSSYSDLLAAFAARQQALLQRQAKRASAAAAPQQPSGPAAAARAGERPPGQAHGAAGGLRPSPLAANAATAAAARPAPAPAPAPAPVPSTLAQRIAAATSRRTSTSSKEAASGAPGSLAGAAGPVSAGSGTGARRAQAAAAVPPPRAPSAPVRSAARRTANYDNDDAVMVHDDDDLDPEDAAAEAARQAAAMSPDALLQAMLPQHVAAVDTSELRPDAGAARVRRLGADLGSSGANVRGAGRRRAGAGRPLREPMRDELWHIAQLLQPDPRADDEEDVGYEAAGDGVQEPARGAAAAARPGLRTPAWPSVAPPPADGAAGAGVVVAPKAAETAAAGAHEELGDAGKTPRARKQKPRAVDQAVEALKPAAAAAAPASSSGRSRRGRAATAAAAAGPGAAGDASASAAPKPRTSASGAAPVAGGTRRRGRAAGGGLPAVSPGQQAGDGPPAASGS